MENLAIEQTEETEEPGLITTKTIEDEIPRIHKYLNACNFNDEQLRRRGNQLKELSILYPSMCTSHLELAWNFCEFTDDKELDDIRLSKRWEGKPKERQMGGIIKNAITIESKTE